MNPFNEIVVLGRAEVETKGQSIQNVTDPATGCVNHTYATEQGSC